MKFVLASASPRRKEILTNAGFEFDIIPSNKAEESKLQETPQQMVERLAYQKAEDVFSKCNRLTLGADTIVCFNDLVLGKPKNEQNAKEMLAMLSGKTHKVYTGFSIISPKRKIVSSDCSLVTFNSLSEETIEEYTRLKLGMDKAGGYGIQDDFGFVKEISGSYFNVMGLPIEKLQDILRGMIDEIENDCN